MRDDADVATTTLTATRHVLPLERLDPDSFERLCLWLMQARHYRDLQHLGAAGSENGRDIVGVRGAVGNPEVIYVQCKRTRSPVTAATLNKEIRKIQKAVADGVAQRPDCVIFAITSEPSATVRLRVEATCAAAGYGVEWLTLNLLDLEVKRQPGILEEFFTGRPEYEPLEGVLPVNSLRAPTAAFVNRDTERGILDELRVTAAAEHRAGVALLCGMGGVGKSALARDWAHENRWSFPGGRLYVDLTQWRRDGTVDMVAVVSHLLADLGVPPTSQPAPFEEKVREYRRMVDRRCLVLLLDDARYPAEVLPLVPGSTGSVVLVTSREWLRGLLVEGAVPVETRPLGDEESAALLTVTSRRSIDSASAAAAAGLVRACGGLPLALATCGAHLLGRGAGAAEKLLRRTAQSASRTSGEILPLSIFDASYEDLSVLLQMAYRRLLGGPLIDLSSFAAAALTGSSIDEAEVMCDKLASLSLLEETDDGWRGHDLVRQHARGLPAAPGDGLGAGQAASAGEAALLAAARRYAWTAHSADVAIVLERPRLGVEDRVARPAVFEPVRTREEAHRWWMRERANVAAIGRLCAEHGWDDELMLLAEGTWPMAVALRSVPEWEATQGFAAEAAGRGNDHRAQARFLSQQARAFADGGSHERAQETCAAATDAALLSKDELMIASVTEFTGICRLEAGHPQEALHSLDQAREAFVRLDVPRGIALQDYYASRALLQLGEPEKALSRIAAAFEALVMSGDEVSVARAQLRRAEAHLALGRPNEAAEAAASARETAFKNASFFEVAQAHYLLAEHATAGGDSAGATAHSEAARDAYRLIGHPAGAD